MLIQNRFYPSAKTQPLTLTIVEMVSRRPDFEASIEAGRVIHDFKTVRILSRVPLAMQAIRNVLKQNPVYKLRDVTAKAYSKEAAEF